jgi:proteasome lid subunit RPN8/RPN11
MNITQEELNTIYAHALDEYPNESCGIVTKDSDGFVAVHKCQNIQNQLHKQDPNLYPRDAKTAYCLDPREYAAILNKAERNGGKVVGFYHSHPDHDAYFSETDRDFALMMGEPIFPEAQYTVVSVYKNKIKEVKSYGWDSNAKDFLQVSKQGEEDAF